MVTTTQQDGQPQQLQHIVQTIPQQQQQNRPVVSKESIAYTVISSGNVRQPSVMRQLLSQPSSMRPTLVRFF